MDTFIAACATDDGERLINRHFGDAKRYDLYELREEGVVFLRTIENTVPEEREHGDAEKASNIGGLLRPAGVQVLVSGQFGQNLKRVRRKFVPVIMRVFPMETALNLLVRNFPEIAAEYRRGEERNHLVIREERVGSDI